MKKIIIATLALGLLAGSAAAAGFPEKEWDKVRVGGSVEDLGSVLTIKSHPLAINSTAPFVLKVPNR